jgi:hypothetical protein
VLLEISLIQLLLIFWFNQSLNQLYDSFQIGNGIQGGIDILIWTVRLLLDINRRFATFKSDYKKAFNSVIIKQSWTQ